MKSDRLVVGLQPVREAIRAHRDALRGVWIREGSPTLDALARFARDQGAAVTRSSGQELDRMAKGAKHQGAVALAPSLRIRSTDELELNPGDRVLALDEINDPQNFGACIRSAVALGASAILWPEHRSAPLSPATFRASAGAIEHATLVRTPSLSRALQELQARGARVLGLAADAPLAVEDAGESGPVVLVVGSEGYGMSKSVRKSCDALVRLRMPGPIDSLNASVAAAVALYSVSTPRS